MKDKVADLLGKQGTNAIDRIMHGAGVPDREYDRILEALQDIDAINECGDLGVYRKIFLQPGLRYSLCMSVIDTILSDRGFDEVPSDKRTEYEDSLRKSVQRMIFTEMVYYQLVRTYNISSWNNKCHIYVDKAKTEYGSVDLFIDDFRKKYDVVGVPDCDYDFARLEELKYLDSTAVIQTILSDSPDECHWTELYDDRVMQQVYKKSGIEAVHKAVIYTGRSMSSPYGDGCYINAEEFFDHTSQIIDTLLEYDNAEETDYDRRGDA